MAAPEAMYGVIGWQASPSRHTRPSLQRGSGSRSKMPHLCTSGAAASTARHFGMKAGESLSHLAEIAFGRPGFLA